MQGVISYWISGPLAKYVASFIFYNSVSPVVDMTSMVLVQPINYFIVFPIMYNIKSSVSTILYRENKANLDDYEII